MFRVSTRTYKVLEANARQDLRRRLVLALRQVFQLETQRMPDSQLEELGDVAVARAEEYRLDLEYSVWALYAAMFVFGRDFETNGRQKSSRDVLFDENLAEDAIVGLLGLRIYMATGKTI